MKVTKISPGTACGGGMLFNYVARNGMTDKDLIKKAAGIDVREYNDAFIKRGKSDLRVVTLGPGTKVLGLETVSRGQIYQEMLELDQLTAILIPWAGVGLTSDLFIAFVDVGGCAVIGGEPAELDNYDLKTLIEDIKDEFGVKVKLAKADHYIRVM